MTTREEKWVNGLIAVLMARPAPEPAATTFDTSDAAALEDAEAIRADERERILTLIEGVMFETPGQVIDLRTLRARVPR